MNTDGVVDTGASNAGLFQTVMSKVYSHEKLWNTICNKSIFISNAYQGPTVFLFYVPFTFLILRLVRVFEKKRNKNNTYNRMGT
jgi:hypothetical protein